MLIRIKQKTKTPATDLWVCRLSESLHKSGSSQSNITKTTKNEHLKLDPTSVQTEQQHSCPEKCVKMGWADTILPLGTLPAANHSQLKDFLSQIRFLYFSLLLHGFLLMREEWEQPKRIKRFEESQGNAHYQSWYRIIERQHQHAGFPMHNLLRCELPSCSCKFRYMFHIFGRNQMKCCCLVLWLSYQQL